MTITFKNILVYQPPQLQINNVTIKDGFLIAIGQQELGAIINFDENYLLTPNFIDLHVHLREPGMKRKETLKTGAKAALYGGYQLVCAMANTAPVLDNYALISKLTKKVKKLPVKIKFFAAITENLAGKKLVNYEKLQELVVGFSDDGQYLANHKLLATILKFALKNQKIVALHVDQSSSLSDEQVLLHQTLAHKFNLKGVTDKFESRNLTSDLQLAIRKNLPYHLCHISTAKSVALIKAAKAKNPKITCEVTPHHLLFNTDMIKTNNSNFKMNPPITTKKSNEAIIQAFNAGVIDIIATDHAPHEVTVKQDLKTAAVGIIGLQTAFASLYTNLVLTQKVPLTKILDGLINGYKLISANKPLLLGQLANFVIIDLHKTQKVTKKFLHSKAKNTPFLNQELTGWPVINVIAGKIYYLIRKEKRWWKN